MNKYRKTYMLIWIILFAAFNAAVFLLVPDTVTVNGITYGKYEGSFWPGYICITAAFIGNLVCSHLFFKRSGSKEKAFLNIPIFTISRTALIATATIGIVTMLIPDFPNWIGTLICLFVLVFYAISIVNATVAADAVTDINARVKQQTSAMKLMTAEAETLLGKASNEEIKAEVKKVYEALRYSDPVSNDALTIIEGETSSKLEEFSENVKLGNTEEVKALSDEIQELISDRAVKCRTMK